mgnify:CR=1 FL=1
MSTRTRLRKIALLAAPACLAVSVAGCSTDDIQFNGGIFDAVGLSDASKSSGGEPQMADRAPLVVPPKIDRLPAPGEAPPPGTQLAPTSAPAVQAPPSQAALANEPAGSCHKN